MSISDLRGKKVLVTGAGAGIGRATALAFAAHGAKLVLCDIDANTLQDTVAAVRLSGTCVWAEVVDVSDRAAMERFAQRVHAAVGTVDILINNAGVYLSGGALQLSLEDWQWVLGVNLWGVVHGCHFFVPRMIERGARGHVVNVASMFGYWPSPGVAGYLTAKFGVFGFSEALREDLRSSGIRVSTVCPGMVRTTLVTNMRIRNSAHAEEIRQRLHGLYTRRNGSPERVAEAIVRAVVKGRSRVELVSAEAWLMYCVQRYLPCMSRVIARHAARRMFHPQGADTR